METQMLFHGALFQRSFFQVVIDHKRDTFHVISAKGLSKKRGEKKEQHWWGLYLKRVSRTSSLLATMHHLHLAISLQSRQNWAWQSRTDTVILFCVIIVPGTVSLGNILWHFGNDNNFHFYCAMKCTFYTAVYKCCNKNYGPRKAGFVPLWALMSDLFSRYIFNMVVELLAILGMSGC